MANLHEVHGPEYDAYLLNQVLKDLDKFDGPLPEGCVEELREAQQLLNKILDKGESNEPA
tara:strand:+ start:269 stop:448 length:180 start_codon:yes stop_codon:yes gene_type:complete